MLTYSVARTTVLSLVGRPGTWLLAAMLVSAWPGLRAFMPLGLVSSELHQATAAYELAFIGGLVGILLGMPALDRLADLLSQIESTARVCAVTAALVACAVLLGACAALPALMFDDWQFATFRTSASSIALILAWIQSALIATSVLRLPLAAPIRGLVVLLAAWLAAALLPWSDHFSLAAASILDPSATLRTSFDFPLSGAHWIRAILSIVVWAAVALWAHSPPRPRSTRP